MNQLFAMEKSALASYIENRNNLLQGADPEKMAAAMGSGASRDTGQLYDVDNRGNAIIPISGMLSRSVNWIDIILGMAPSRTYNEIVQAVQEADEDPAVSRIVLLINSPGGHLDGLDSTGQAIAAVKKPVYVYGDNLIASAAYWLASQADKIILTSPAAQTGRIGIMAVLMDKSGLEEKIGIKPIRIISSGAPLKYPDPKTEEGLRQIQGQVDQLHSIFIERVASGRKVSKATVSSSYGQGDIVFAKTALAVGMIDDLQEAAMVTDGSSAQPDEAAMRAFREKIKKLG